ncbi:MAG: hypothetical protein ACM31G_07150 [Flavobacteriales bacterium]
MKNLKTTLVFAIILISITINAQCKTCDEWFLSIGIDPAIASGTNILSKGDRVGSGHLNYLVQFGRENYQEGEIQLKFGIQVEQFKAIHYRSFGTFGGITFSAPRIPGTDLSIGHFWFITPEINLISRKGIQDSKDLNPDSLTTWSLGTTLGIRINEPELFKLKIPFNLEFQLNAKDRLDIAAHYTGEPFGINRIVVSGYVVAVFNF